MQKGDEMRGKEFDWLDKQNIGGVKFEIMDIIHLKKKQRIDSISMTSSN